MSPRVHRIKADGAHREDVEARVEVEIDGASAVLLALFGRELYGSYSLPVHHRF